MSIVYWCSVFFSFLSQFGSSETLGLHKDNRFQLCNMSNHIKNSADNYTRIDFEPNNFRLKNVLQYPLSKCIGQYVKSKYSSILIRGQAATWERILQTLEISTMIGGFTQVGQSRSTGHYFSSAVFKFISYKWLQEDKLGPNGDHQDN